MENQEDVSPNFGSWQSPEDFASGSRPTSTPNGSSRQDSGYSSLTPRSTHCPSPSPSYLFRPYNDHRQSTPIYTLCSCKQPRSCKNQSPLDLMTIREGVMDSGYSSLTPRSTHSPSPSPSYLCRPYNDHRQSAPIYTLCSCKQSSSCKNQSPPELMTICEGVITPSFSSRQKRNRPLELDDDSMDTSLYPEVELGPMNSAGLECPANTMDISDETSMDFVDNMFVLPSSTVTGDMMELENYESELKKHYVESLSSGKVIKPLVKPPKLEKTKREKSVNFLEMAKKIQMSNYVVRTFGACLRGIEEMDILFQLGVKRSCPIVISNIFSHLSEKDLDNVMHVSKTWKEILVRDKDAFERWNLYKTKLLLRKENYTSPTKAGSRPERLAFGVLQPITNQQGPMSSPRRSPPVSPSSARHRHARQVAGTVRKGDRVLKCPKCAFSVADRGLSPSAQCRRSGCRHKFCVHCRGEVTSGEAHDCLPLRTPRSLTSSASKVKVPAVGSKRGKRNLRRTLIGVENS